MMLAQTLYEGVKTPDGTSGVITYMRTDSLNMAAEAVEAARDSSANATETSIFQMSQVLREKVKRCTRSARGNPSDDA